MNKFSVSPEEEAFWQTCLQLQSYWVDRAGFRHYSPFLFLFDFVVCFFFNITWICYLEKRTVNHLENLYKLDLHLYRIRIKWIKKTGYSVWEGQGSLFPGWNLKIWPSYSIHIIEFEWKLPCCSPVFKVKLIPTSWTHQQFLCLSVWMILFSIKTSLLVSNLPLYCI